MQTILNFTPHPVAIFSSQKEKIARFLSVGSIRLTEETIPAESPVKGIPAVYKSFVGVSVIISELPKKIVNPVVIVSLPVLQALKDSPTLKEKFLKILKEKGISSPAICCPDTGNDSVVRDEQGRILGVRRIIVL